MIRLFEIHGYPNAANQPEFPGVVLHPGEVYQRVGRYRLEVVE